MFEHVPWIVKVVQYYLGMPLASLLQKLGIEVTPEQLFPVHVVTSLLIILSVVVFVSIMKKRLSIYPSMMQYIVEGYVGFINSMVIDIIGEKGKKYLPCIGTLGVFILLSNLLGLIPGLASPTSNINITGGCAIFIFVYYHWQGIREQGIGK